MNVLDVCYSSDCYFCVFIYFNMPLYMQSKHLSFPFPPNLKVFPYDIVVRYEPLVILDAVILSALGVFYSMNNRANDLLVF